MTALQRYEAASTLYGPWTLNAYQQLYSMLADAMLSGKTVPPGPTPPNLYDRTVRGRQPQPTIWNVYMSSPDMYLNTVHLPTACC